MHKTVGDVDVYFNQYAVIEYAGLPVEAYYGALQCVSMLS